MQRHNLTSRSVSVGLGCHLCWKSHKLTRISECWHRVTRSDHRLWDVPGSLAFTLTWILGIVRLYWKWNLDLEPVTENKPQSKAIAGQGEQKALEWGSYPDRRKCEIWEAKALYREKNGPRLLDEGEPRAGSCFFGSELKLITSRWRFLRIPQWFLLMLQS